MRSFRAFFRLAAFGATGFTLVAAAFFIQAHSIFAHTPEILVRRRKDAFLKNMLKVLCRVCGIRVHADAASLQIASKGSRFPSLILANHVSYLDVVILGSLFPCGFLAKKEVAHWPVVGWSGLALGMEFVDREKLTSRVKTLRRLKNRLRTSSICVFPEGTTTSSTTPDEAVWQRGQLWSAEARAGRVLCVGLHYAEQSELAWTGDMAFAPHLWSVLKRRHTDVFVCGEHLAVQAVPPSRIYENAETRPVDARACSKNAFESVSRLCRKARALAIHFQGGSEPNTHFLRIQRPGRSPYASSVSEPAPPHRTSCDTV